MLWKKTPSTILMKTENAIRQLDRKVQNTFRYMATRKVNKSWNPVHTTPYTEGINTTSIK